MNNSNINCGSNVMFIWITLKSNIWKYIKDVLLWGNAASDIRPSRMLSHMSTASLK